MLWYNLEIITMAGIHLPQTRGLKCCRNVWTMPFIGEHWIANAIIDGNYRSCVSLCLRGDLGKNIWYYLIENIPEKKF